MASVALDPKVVEEIRKSVPDWFRPIPGFTFKDESGDIYRVIGFGGWRSYETFKFVMQERDLVTDEIIREYPTTSGDRLMMRPFTLVCAMKYKGEWSLIDFFVNPLEPVNWEEYSPVETPRLWETV